MNGVVCIFWGTHIVIRNWFNRFLFKREQATVLIFGTIQITKLLQVILNSMHRYQPRLHVIYIPPRGESSLQYNQVGRIRVLREWFWRFFDMSVFSSQNRERPMYIHLRFQNIFFVCIKGFYQRPDFRYRSKKITKKAKKLKDILW